MDISEKIEAVAHGLQPVVRIEGQAVRWSMAERMEHYVCPGVGVAVIDNGRLDWARGFGRCDVESDAPVTDGTIFMGASISKPVTAIIVMALVDQGILDLDTDVRSYLRSWALPENDFTRAAPVTLRWLLSHKAGTTVHGYGGEPPSHPHPSLIDVLDGRHRTPPVKIDKEPGGSIRYSGGGYLILQQVLEDVTGQSFPELARRLVFAPLHLGRTTFEQPPPPALLSHAAAGHDENGRPLAEKILVVPGPSAGGIWTTAAEYARLMIAVWDAYHGVDAALLSFDAAREMLSLQGDGDQGLGWRLLGDGPMLRMDHGGSNDGYQCQTLMYLESGKGAVVLTNSANGLFFYWEILNAIADVYDWTGFLAPPKRIYNIPPQDQINYVGEYEIVWGVDAPMIIVTSENGQLYSEIPGMRGGKSLVLAEAPDRLFSTIFPYETQVIFGHDGRVREMVVYEGGSTMIVRAVRVSAGPRL